MNDRIPRIISGDGDTYETPIKFEPCDVQTRVRAEHQYIALRFGREHFDWTRGPHFTRFSLVSEWHIDLADGSSRSVFFDALVSYDE